MTLRRAVSLRGMEDGNMPKTSHSVYTYPSPLSTALVLLATGGRAEYIVRYDAHVDGTSTRTKVNRGLRASRGFERSQLCHRTSDDVLLHSALLPTPTASKPCSPGGRCLSISQAHSIWGLVHHAIAKYTLCYPPIYTHLFWERVRLIFIYTYLVESKLVLMFAWNGQFW